MTTTALATARDGPGDRARLPSVSVIVPAYNEALVVEDTLGRLSDYMARLSERYDWEIVVVDDGSVDGTGELAQAFADSHENIRVLRHPVNLMLGQALRTAFNACTSDYLVVIDCDLTYSPDHVGRLLDAIVSTGARVVLASPYMAGGSSSGVPLLRNLASRLANRILSLAASGRIRTLTGMVRAYDRRFVSALNLKAMGTEVNTEIIYKAQLLRARIIEIPAHLDWSATNRMPRRSSVRMASGTIRSLLSAFIFRPFMFFIVPGATLAFVTLVGVILTWGEEGEGLARDFHVVSEFGLLVSGILLTMGVMALQSKRYFEELFHLGTTVLREIRSEREKPARGPGGEPERERSAEPSA